MCVIDCLACQDELFVNNPLDAKANDEHALDFVFTCDRSSVSLSPLGELLLLLWVITVHPALVANDNPGQEGCIVAVSL
jgi:hypothetical protein